MSTIVLAINAGSSSVKLSLYKASASTGQELTQLAEAEVTDVTAPPAHLKYTRGPEHIKGLEVPDVSNQKQAFQHVLERLINDEGLPELKHKDDVKYACHRIVHGGDYGKVHVIDRSTFHHLEELSDLAPLHNAVGLSIVRVVHEELPRTTNMAYFDSAFHSSMPRHIRTYAIDPKVAERNKLRKYGFHGISYAFITKAVAGHLKKPVDETNLIALHLGSGASACAIRGGKSLDTSYGSGGFSLSCRY